MKKIIENKYFWIIILIISFVFFLSSLIFFSLKIETEVKVSAPKVINAAIFFEENIKEEIWKNTNLYDLQMPDINFDTIDTKTLIEYISNNIDPIYSDECMSLESEEYRNYCLFNFYYKQYSFLVDQKWLVDLELCNKIKDLFGEYDTLYNKCIFVYAINHNVKFNNISKCDLLKDIPILVHRYREEACIEQSLYSILWQDEIVWEYIRKAEFSTENKDSILYNNITNKYWEVFVWNMVWVEYYFLNLEEEIKKMEEEYNFIYNNN